MRIAVLADIHGNSAALDAVLEDVDRRGIATLVNLGDSLCGPLDPVGTAERLMARNMPTIAGNHDRWLLDRPPEDQPLWEQWTYPLLSDLHFEWLRALPATQEVHGVLMTHGTPLSDTENWLHQRAADGGMAPASLPACAAPADGITAPVILSGHTHLPRIVRLPDGPLLVNPGSVGCPAYLNPSADPPFYAEAGTPDASYAVLEFQDGQWRASLHLVPYSPDDMVAKARALGATEWVIALTTGWSGRNQSAPPQDHQPG